ncbi:hypothetical protein [Minwuia sp.]|uniref:hypothetical protein n=1 Tax=Minwuia sp. TaxID=2493630 RepID=UPI003A95683C
MEAHDYRYPAGAIFKDFAGAVIGLTVFGAPALFVPLSSVMVALLGGLGLLFAVFALRTLIRQQSRLLIDEHGVRMTGPVSRAIAWDDLSEVRLRFYSTWRDRKSGWMQLGLKGNGSAIRVDQALNGFSEVAETVFSMAEARGVTFDATTRQNAGALGLDLHVESGRPH